MNKRSQPTHYLLLLVAIIGFAYPLISSASPAQPDPKSLANTLKELQNAVSGAVQTDASDSLRVRLSQLQAPMNVTAEDVPNDGGKAIKVKWQYPEVPFELPTELQIFRLSDRNQQGDLIGKVGPLVHEAVDNSVENGVPTSYRVQALFKDGAVVASGPSTPAIAVVSYFNWNRLNQLVISIILIGAVLVYIFLASRGVHMKIRKISGIEAIEEAVGRSTEMGKPILYVPGTQDMDNVQTIAGINILGSVAKMAAKYETRLDVPVARSIAMSTGRETVHEAYLTAGRPDLYHDDIVHYITDEQFGFVAAIDGIMVRDKPAACIYMGAFYAESLILAETGNSIGAIQIAGTAMPTQLPFFVAACDYTLIGEELFAASAYLSGDQREIGSLKGQDFGKAVAMGLIMVTSLLWTVYNVTQSGAMEKAYKFFFDMTSSTF